MNHRPHPLDSDQVRTRLPEFTVIDVRTPAESATGHLPGAFNIPLDRLDRALPDIRRAAERRDVLVVCASGARSENACRVLADSGVAAATFVGGTGAWAARGHDLHHPHTAPRAAWSMERQVRFAAGLLVLLGLALGLLHPAFQLVSAAIAGGLVLSALTGTCGLAVMLARLPRNRPRAADLDAALAALRAAPVACPSGWPFPATRTGTNPAEAPCEPDGSSDDRTGGGPSGAESVQRMARRDRGRPGPPGPAQGDP